MKTSALTTALLAVALGACTTEVAAPPRHQPATPDGPIHAPSSPRAPVDDFSLAEDASPLSAAAALNPQRTRAAVIPATSTLLRKPHAAAEPAHWAAGSKLSTVQEAALETTDASDPDEVQVSPAGPPSSWGLGAARRSAATDDSSADEGLLRRVAPEPAWAPAAGRVPARSSGPLQSEAESDLGEAQIYPLDPAGSGAAGLMAVRGAGPSGSWGRADDLATESSAEAHLGGRVAPEQLGPHSASSFFWDPFREPGPFRPEAGRGGLEAARLQRARPGSRAGSGVTPDPPRVRRRHHTRAHLPTVDSDPGMPVAP